MLEFAGAVGLKGLLERVEEERRARARGRVQVSEDPAAAYSGRNYMTRRMYERTRGELESLETALRTTIPQAILKARELGDLRENAEYHSAKLKQSQAEARVLLLAERLREVTIIDDLPADAGVAGPGTEVEIAIEGGAVQRYWILGEGDNDLGPEVVSYRAAIGRALLGRRVGDPVTWTTDGRETRGTVRAVTPRRPA
jgi:transcription elongation factor GreA